ncbi:MAG: hypothetical protein H7145_18715 [Akkermansiaceae bacterium]|nr:hypothetical protein [Armatimonadota bacterium]
METEDEIAGLRAMVRTMDARLRALEGTPPPPSESGFPEPWGTSLDRFGETLRQARKDDGRAFALAVGHIIMQDASSGGTSTRLSVTTFDRATDMPDDGILAERRERVRLLTSSDAPLRIFRHFYALRFSGKPRRATGEALAEAVGETAASIGELLEPFVADETLLLVSDGDGGDTYEWRGNDILITTLLFGAI